MRFRVTAPAGIAAAVLAITASSASAAPVKATSVRIYLPHALIVGRQAVTVPGRGVRVAAIVRPYVPGQTVKLRAIESGRVIKSVRLRLQPSRDGRYGHASLTIPASEPGRIRLLAGHSRNRDMRAFLASRPVTVLDENGVQFGSSGLLVQLIQRQLAALHFFIPQTGVYDAGTGWAIDAYHRLLRQGTSQNIDRRTINELVDLKGSFPVRYPKTGEHVEANLSTQLLALINGSHVYWIVPTSSGKPSTPTPPGRFHIYLQEPGLLSDGMFYSSFFNPKGAGYAIHGYNPAPDYPASHGCLRIPIPDAKPVYHWLHKGDGVDVYY